MRKSTVLFLVILILFSFQTSGICQEVNPQEELWDYLSGIVGKTHDGRRDYIIDRLLELRVDFKIEPFSFSRSGQSTTRVTKGENIIAFLGSGDKRIIVGGHYDAVPNSPGANDNGAAIAIILNLIKHLKDIEHNYRIEFICFDHEERGLLGSREYVKRHPKDDIFAMINLDVVGLGDMLYIHPVGGGDDDVIMSYIRKTVKNLNVKIEETTASPGSDYFPFMNAKIENIGISAVPEDALPFFNRFFLQRDRTITREEMPVIMKYMHTPKDNLDYISKEAMEMVFLVLKNVVMNIDKDYQ